jgi:hypothetical protein
MYKGWAFSALAPRPTVLYCALINGKIGARKIHTFSHKQLTLTTLCWKRNGFWSVHRCWMLNADRKSRVRENRHFAFGLLVQATVFSRRCNLCCFISRYAFHEFLQLNQNRFVQFRYNRCFDTLSPCE